MVRDYLRNLMAFAPEDEEGVAAYCCDELAHLGLRVRQDETGNIYADSGVWAHVCLNAHLDCRPEGIGADDRCGIAAILGAVDTVDAWQKVLLTTGEESGGIGSQEVPDWWWAGVNLCASFDRHGNTDIITHYAGRQLAPDATLERVAQVARRCGIRPNLTPSKSMADAYRFAEHVPCVNIATGFYDEHSRREYYVLEDVETAACVAAALVREDWYLDGRR